MHSAFAFDASFQKPWKYIHAEVHIHIHVSLPPLNVDVAPVLKLNAICNVHWIHHGVVHACNCHYDQVDAGRGIANGRTDADPYLAARKWVMPLFATVVHAHEVLSLPPHLEYDAFADSEAAHIFAQMHGSKLCKAIQHANTTNTLKHHISKRNRIGCMRKHIFLLWTCVESGGIVSAYWWIALYHLQNGWCKAALPAIAAFQL